MDMDRIAATAREKRRLDVQFGNEGHHVAPTGELFRIANWHRAPGGYAVVWANGWGQTVAKRHPTLPPGGWWSQEAIERGQFRRC